MNTKRIFATLAYSISCTVALAASEPVTSALHAELDRIEATCAQVASVVETSSLVKKSEGPAFYFKGANDLDITLDGSARVDYGRSYNLETFNSKESHLDRCSGK